MKSVFCKKHYLYIGFAAISLSLAITSHVFAHEDGDTPHDEHQSNQIVNSVPGKEADAMAERKSALPEQIQNRIVNLSHNMIQRMEAAAGRMDQITGRMETRIEKLKGQNVDTELAETVLVYAKTSLSDAYNTLEELDGTIQHAVTSDSPKESFKEVREAFIAVKYSIRDTQTHLRTILGLLKDAVRDAELGRGVSDAVTDHTTEKPGTDGHDDSEDHADETSSAE